VDKFLAISAAAGIGQLVYYGVEKHQERIRVMPIAAKKDDFVKAGQTWPVKK